ncbi:MAG: glycoside hydrolase family 31 protein [Bacteroidales bacterium]|nr:glycoside hydrolase family 31 protein [Bacteroidales bacterium]
MKKNSTNYSACCAAIALALPLTIGGTLPTQAAAALPHSAVSAVSALNADAQLVSDVRKLNPTTVEVIYANGKMLTLDFYGANIVRLFRDDNGGIVRDPQASPAAEILTSHPRRATGGVTLTKNGGTATVATPRITVNLNLTTGLFSIVNNETGETIVNESSPIAFEKSKTTLTLSAKPDEYFFGGGVQNGRFSHKGKIIAIENTNNWVDGGVASPTPFYWSTKGYGVLWHTFKPGTYDFGATEEGKVILSHGEAYLDVFIMVNDGAVNLLNDFYQLTGNPVLLPKFGFYQGHLNAYNRDYWTEAENGFMLYEDGKRYNESQKDNGGIKESLNGEKNNYQFSARAAIDRYIKNDMPLGWFLPNDGYGAGYGQTGTLDGNVQNLKEFGDYARSKGVEIGLWTQSDLHPKEGVEALLQRDIVKEVRDAGVRVLKTDVAWVGAGYSFGLNGVADVGEIMPYYGSNARPFIISLDGWAGTQRYAGIWSGDQTGGDWEYIRFHIPTFIGSGLSGQPNITSDVDGIFGGKNVPVNVREFQWKTFTPMELNMDGWGSNPKYPEVLGEPATSINRTYLKLKAELMPYTYSIAAEAVDGKPMIRAMFLDYPNDYTLGTATQYQFMYGPSFLVAPIYKDTKMDKDGNDIRNGIYLPEGKWVDYFTGDVYTGGRLINNFDAPLWKIPVFVKSDAIIPMTNPNNNPSQIRQDYRAYEIYADQGTEFNEYDDDGKTQEYLSGASTHTLISTAVEKDELTVSIAPTVGSYDGFENQKETELRINVSAQPEKVTAKVNGRKVKRTAATSLEAFESGSDVYFYNEKPQLNRFATPGSDFAKVDITKNPQLLVKLAKADVSETTVEVTVAGYEYAPASRFLVSTGSLSAPKPVIADSCIGSFELTPSWAPVANADFYEVEFNGMLYSTIREQQFSFDGLTPEATYSFKVRAVNKDGYSEWATVSATTKSNPLEFAIKGIKAQATCEDQPGTPVSKLFDFDPKSGWHSKWGEGTAVPFDMTLDLRSVNQLDRIEYTPRADAGNGTLLKGQVSYSTDRQNWSTPVDFTWAKDGNVKTFAFDGNPQARYVKIAVSAAVGNFASGTEMYVFKVADTESVIQGDINRDKRIDENDLTSYMNYTGLRRGDSDFDYVSLGDINQNGLIDAYDISVVTTELDGGVRNSNDKVSGSVVLTPNKTTYAAGDVIEIKVSGKALHYVNGLSFALPYDTQELEYVGTELIGMKDMVNLTYDRLHTNGQKALYPTFVNRGNNFLLDEGDHDLFVIKFKAKKAGKFSLKAQDGILVDRNLGAVSF